MKSEIVALAKALKLPAFADYQVYIKDSSSTEEVLYNLLAAEHAI